MNINRHYTVPFWIVTETFPTFLPNLPSPEDIRRERKGLAIEKCQSHLMSLKETLDGLKNSLETSVTYEAKGLETESLNLLVSLLKKRGWKVEVNGQVLTIQM